MLLYFSNSVKEYLSIHAGNFVSMSMFRETTLDLLLSDENTENYGKLRLSNLVGYAFVRKGFCKFPHVRIEFCKGLSNWR